MVMTQKQVEQITAKSKLNEEEMTWVITPFLFKENMLIFPETTARSLGDLLKKQKEKINMFVSEDSRKDYLKQKQRADSLPRALTERNTKESFAFSDNTAKKRNNSLASIA